MCCTCVSCARTCCSHGSDSRDTHASPSCSTGCKVFRPLHPSAHPPLPSSTLFSPREFCCVMADSKAFMGAISLADVVACGGPSSAACCLLTCLLLPARDVLHVMHAVVCQSTGIGPEARRPPVAVLLTIHKINSRVLRINPSIQQNVPVCSNT